MFLDHFLCKDNYNCTLDSFFFYKILTITIHTQKESIYVYFVTKNSLHIFVYIKCTGCPKNLLKEFSGKAKRYFSFPSMAPKVVLFFYLENTSFFPKNQKKYFWTLIRNAKTQCKWSNTLYLSVSVCVRSESK